ncbi:thiamine phosphate synthase [Anaerosinus massiliensis]|uniref:thiamine phosphate synthase n=1 Tax=Massilibacillus massiliensis TaxID=1806837 RepID=UPI000A4137F8|nr:thiamine phosphate synthase [Massilibacillus massiliensis]
MKKQGMDNFSSSGIYALTAENLSKGRSNIQILDALIEAGITFFQYREKEKKAKEMYEECRIIREKTQRAGVTFIVNDHIDLAMAVKADGVHIGQEDLPPEVVRKLIGNTLILGLSTHNPEQMRLAECCEAVDYIGVGPVFATKTKKDVCDAVGLDYVRYVANNSKLPFVAIGGIKEENIADVSNAGAKTIAVVSDIVGAEDIVAKVRRLRQQMSS